MILVTEYNSRRVEVKTGAVGLSIGVFEERGSEGAERGVVAWLTGAEVAALIAGLKAESRHQAKLVKAATGKR